MAKTYSDPCRRRHPLGATTAVIDGKRERVYRGWFSRTYDREAKTRGWAYLAADLESAKVKKRDLERLDAAGEGAVTEAGFGAAVDEFLTYKRGELAPGAKAAATHNEEPTRWLEEIHRRLGKFKLAFPGKTVAGITTRDVERYFARRTGGAKSKNMDRGILKEFFAWARKHKLTRSDPTGTTKKQKEPRRQPRSLTRDEEISLLRACADRYTVDGIKGKRGTGSRKGGVSEDTGAKWSQTFGPPAWLHPLTLLALRTALRMGNLLRLEWRHVDLRKGFIRVRAEEIKNNTDLELPLHPEAAALLADLRERAAALATVPLRVLDACGSPLPDRRAASRAFSGAVERAGINPPITFHGLRKVAATRMLQGGVDLKTVMAVGGWNDPGTLIRLYAAATDEAKRAAVAKL